MSEQREKIREIIKETKSLPTIPGIVGKLNALSNDQKTSIKEMANIVSADQVLSAKMLRLANSPSYGFARISTVSNAMILLGIDVVKSLVLSSSIFEIMENNVMGLWEHSLGAGVAANIIVRRLNLKECEEISTAALLHDIGKVILKLKFEDEYAALGKLVTARQMWFRDAEMELLGTDHAEVGGWLATSWFLPDKLVEPIACHHDVSKSGTHQIRTAVVHVADIMIKAAAFGFSGDPFVPRLQPAAVRVLGLNETILSDIAEELGDRLIDIKNFSLEMQETDG